MRNRRSGLLRTRFLAPLTIAVAFTAGCPSKPTVKTDDQGKQIEDAGTPTGEPEKVEDKGELTVRRVIVPETPKYVEGVDHAAQDSFKAGVVAVYQSPPDYEAAVSSFKDAIEKDKKFLEAYFNLGMTYERQKEPEKALEVYQQALSNNPDSLDAKAYVARIFLAKSQAANVLGNDAEATQLKTRAKQLLDEIVVKDAENVAGNNALALYFHMQGDQKMAETYVRKVLEIEPYNTSALNTRGLINYQNKEYRIAKWIFERKVLRADPNSTEALTNLGLTYLAMADKPRAVASFKKAIELDPENIPARLNLAAIYLDYLNYEQARDQFKLVIDQQADNVEALIGFGTANWGLQDYPTAVESYVKVTELTQKYPELLLRLAKIHEGPLSDTKLAIEWYKKYSTAMNLPPDDIINQQIKLLESGAFDNPPPDAEQPQGEGEGSGGEGKSDQPSGEGEGTDGATDPPAEGTTPE